MRATCCASFCLVVLVASLFLQNCSDDSTSPVIRQELVVKPVEITEEVAEGINPERSVIVRGQGDTALPYRATESSFWMQLFPVSEPSGMTPDTFSVRMSTISPQIKAGNRYIDTVWVSSTAAANSPLPVEVSLTVKHVVQATPEQFTFTAQTGGQNPESQVLKLEPSRSTPFDYTLTHFKPWLILSRESGQAPDEIEVSVDVTGLRTGVYLDSIVVDVPTAVESPVVRCSLIVASWRPQVDPLAKNLKSVYFVDANTGWAVGQVDAFGSSTGYILGTLNGGNDWSIQLIQTPYPLGDVHFATSLIGFAVGGKSDTVATQPDIGVVLRTLDGGTTWEEPLILDTVPLQGVHFVNADVGWTIGRRGKIWYTGNGGDSWMEQESGTTADLIDVFFLNTSVGWVVGNGATILKTVVAGANWEAQSFAGSEDLRSIYFRDETTGWLVGETGIILSTTDGGVTWPRPVSSTSEELWGVGSSGNRAWAVGTEGTIVYTLDGITWNPQPSGTENWLFDVFFIDENTGWIVGDKGTILKTFSGGL